MALPPQVALVKFFSPQKSDQGLIEIWAADVASYYPLDVGASHPNTREYPGFKLGKQLNLPNDHTKVIRIWVKDTTNPEWFGYSIKYVSEANAFPIFIHSDRIARVDYAPETKGQPLRSIYKLMLTAAGSGYTVGTFPTLTFNNGGTGGSGASGYAVVNPDGTIGELVLDTGGTGYNTAPTFTVAAPPAGGTTATGTATIQPSGALLVAEEAKEFPDDSEFFGLYLQVTRVYQTLPGPILRGQRWDERVGVTIFYTVQETAVGEHLGESRTEIEIIDSVRQKVTVTDYVPYLAYRRVFAGLTRLELPPVLELLDPYFDGRDGSGQFTGTIGDCHWFDSGSWSYSLRGEGQGSAAVAAHVQHSVRENSAAHMQSQRAVFFLPSPVTMAQVLAVLSGIFGASVSVMPNFKKVSVTVLLVSESISLQAEAQEHVQDGGSGASAEEHSEYGGYGDSRGHSKTIEGMVIPPCLHGTISINSSQTADASASAAAGSNSSSPGDETVTGRVIASAAASVPTSVPNTGLYAIALDPEPYQDLIMYHAEIVDMSLA